MSFLNNKNNFYQEFGELKAKVKLLEEANNELKEEKKKLQNQVISLQEAIIAVKNPESYQMLTNDRLAKNWENKAYTDMSKNLNDEQLKFLKEYQAASELPFFSKPEDIDFLLKSESIESKLLDAQGSIEFKAINDSNES